MHDRPYPLPAGSNECIEWRIAHYTTIAAAPLYREASTYPHLVDGQFLGNPEPLAVDDLHRRAWEIVEPIFLDAANAAVAAYQQLAGTGRTSTEVMEIVLAAYDGRIETLFIAGVPVWGRFDEVRRNVHLGGPQAPGDEDLSNYAAIQTLLRGGRVFALERARMPVDAPLNAAFRY